jgi:chitinase
LSVEAPVAPSATMVPPDQASQVPAATPQVPGALLSYQVIDAEYSLALDRIVMISDDPAQLHVYDPSTGSDATVDLSRSPSSVSVAPDGSFAAVGHDRRISYVDLKSARLVKTLNVATDACDVVLAGNGWVYASPGTGQHGRLRAVDLETNKEFESTGILVHARNVYKLQPDGQSLYGAERGKSPVYLQKLDISDGVPVHLYDSPSHSGYPAGGDLWLSEDGQRIFTAGGSVLRTSSNPKEDMTYVGSLANLERIRHVVHSSAAGLILAIPSKGSAVDSPRFPSPGTNHVLIFGYENLDLQRTLTLPEYVVNGLPYDAIGRFVFANAAGTQYYVIVQADGGSGLLQDFSIFTGEL